MTASTPTLIALASLLIAIAALAGSKRLGRQVRRPRLMQSAAFAAAALLVPLDAYCALSAGEGTDSADAITGTARLASVSAVSAIGILFMATRIPRTRTERPKRILAIGAHPDDLELGCGGTLAKLADQGHELHLLVMTNGARGGDRARRPREALRGARFLGAASVEVLELGDTRLREHELEMVQAIEAAIGRIGPNVILTHSFNDQHQDHLAVHLATLRAARFHSTILCYESPSATQAFTPSVFIDIDGYVEVKAMAVAAHRDQRQKPYMSAERVRGLAIYRGGQAKVRHAEGYEAVRVLGASVFEP